MGENLCLLNRAGKIFINLGSFKFSTHKSASSEISKTGVPIKVLDWRWENERGTALTGYKAVGPHETQRKTPVGMSHAYCFHELKFTMREFLGKSNGLVLPERLTEVNRDAKWCLMSFCTGVTTGYTHCVSVVLRQNQIITTCINYHIFVGYITQSLINHGDFSSYPAKG